MAQLPRVHGVEVYIMWILVTATGGTIVAAIEELKKRGVDHRLMRVVSK